MKPLHINFLTIKKKSDAKMILLLLIFISCSVYITIVNLYIFLKQKNIIEQYQNKAEFVFSESNKNNISSIDTEELKSDIKLLNTLLKYKHFPYLDILTELESSIDSGVIFDTINIDRDKNDITLKGSADSEESLSFLLKNISSKEMFLLNSLSLESKKEELMYVYFNMELKIR